MAAPTRAGGAAKVAVDHREFQAHGFGNAQTSRTSGRQDDALHETGD